MKNETNDPEWHLNDPRTRKWMVQCVACQRIGYQCDAPQQFFGRCHLVKQFQPLKLSSSGLCEECQQGSSRDVSSDGGFEGSVRQSEDAD